MRLVADMHAHEQAVVGEETFLDPTDRESRASTGSVVLACMPALGTVTSLWQSGRMKPVDVIEVSCASLSLHLTGYMLTFVLGAVRKDLREEVY